MTDVRGFSRRSSALAAALAAVASALAWPLLGAEVALGVALGTAVAHASFVGLARDLSSALGIAAAQARAAGGQPSASTTDLEGAQPHPTQGKEGEASEQTPEIPALTTDPAHLVGLEGARQIRARALLKWPLVGLALAGILWYMPARPEGVALGVVLSLVAAVLAALLERPQPTTPEGPAPPPGV